MGENEQVEFTNAQIEIISASISHEINSIFNDMMSDAISEAINSN